MRRNHTHGWLGRTLTACVCSLQISRLMRLFTFLLHCDLSPFKHKPHEPCWPRAAWRFIVILPCTYVQLIFPGRQLTQSLSTALYSSGQSLKSTFPINARIPPLCFFLSTPPWKCQHQYYNVFCVHPCFGESRRRLTRRFKGRGIFGKTGGPAVWSTAEI